MMRQMIWLVTLAIIGTALPQRLVHAHELQAMAWIDVGQSKIEDGRNGSVSLKLELSQPVPFRVFTMNNPARVVIDFREVDWTGFDEAAVDHSKRVTDLRFGIFHSGWSRLILDLNTLVVPDQTEMRINQMRSTATLKIDLIAVDEEVFADFSTKFKEDSWALPKPTGFEEPKERQPRDQSLMIVIDPGHGGVDSGAERDGYEEKHLVMQFALELEEMLVRTGRYKVDLTRRDDVFMSLPDRISRARYLGADVFLSIHADALSKGSATGTTVYTLSDEASSTMVTELVAKYDRGNLLAGVNLVEQDDQIASVLMNMARLQTDLRSEMLADFIVEGIAQSSGRIRKRPHLGAGFAVLKAPDIPSVLVELGFMSNKSDLNNLLAKSWRDKVVLGIVDALDKWTLEDAAQGVLMRQ